MNAKRVAMNERRLRYRRLRRERKGVSPVVATLILILIAVAAAAALYLWLTGWQGGVTKSIGNPHVPSDLSFTIGGSSTVYPFTQDAATWFIQNNTNSNITDQQGGSAAGLAAVCAGDINVGASSTAYSASQLGTNNCPSTTTQTVVGYDAVVAIESNSNAFLYAAGKTVGGASGAASGLTLNDSELAAIYAVNGGAAPTELGALGIIAVNQEGDANAAAAITGTLNTAANCAAYSGTAGPIACWFIPTGDVSGAPAYTWYDVPTKAGFATGTGWSTFTTYAVGAANNGVTAFGANVIGSVSGAVTNHNIDTYGRADQSGTEQGFVQQLLGTTCGTDNEFASCGITPFSSLTGESALQSAVAKDPDGLGFDSWGFATSAGSNVVLNPFWSAALPNGGSYHGGAAANTAAVSPTLTNILEGISSTSGGATANAASYMGYRYLEYITTQTPTAIGGVVLAYLQFVYGPQVNQALCTATGFISLYATGAPAPPPLA